MAPRILVWMVAVVVGVSALGVAEGVAATKLYDMEQLLFAPHPFAQNAPAPTRAAPSPAPRLQREVSSAPAPTPPRDSSQDIPFDVPEPTSEISDPLEPMNRFFFGFNEILNDFVLGPIARGYNSLLPDPIREGVSNFFDNLNVPVVLANDLLQGELGRAWDTTARGVINSTAGVGGFFDVAKKLGFEEHSEDFGQTLAVWGVGEGFYLVLPLFGPSNPRDAVGKLFVDSFFDPLGYYLDNTDQTELSYARTGVGGLVTLADVIDELDTLRDTSVDFYGALRSLYGQRRTAEIRNNKNNESDIPNFDLDIK